jgi:prepilin-type N-terminal cleavage/methylation domain-containing protein
MRPAQASRGFSLVELTVVIIIIGVLMAVAMKAMTGSVDQSRRAQTEREMDALLDAIAGNPDRLQNGTRTDFGYLGDVGAFPPNLRALQENPGAFATWDGPYLPPGLTQDSTGYLNDAWGKAYTFSGGLAIGSSGGGTPLTRSLPGKAGDYLRNGLAGVVEDAEGTPPDSILAGSVAVRITVPDGSGAWLSKLYRPDPGGAFTADSLPVGHHPLEIIFEPNADTLRRLVTIVPRNRGTVRFRFAAPYFTDTTSEEAETGPVAHWKLDETGGTTASDASGNGHHGTLVNMDPGSDWVSGKVGGALDFDGSNDYVDCDNQLSHLTDFSVTAWVNPSSVGTDRQIVSKGYNGSITQWELKTTTGSGKVGFRHWAPGASGVQSNQKLTAGTWTHLAGTYDGTTWRLYWDGLLDAESLDGGPVETDQRLLLGAVDINGSPGQLWRGRLDDIRLYDRVLDSAEIAELAEDTEVGLVAWWRFDEHGGPNASDASGHGLAGTLVNMNPGHAWVGGHLDNALAFDGIDDYVLVSPDPLFAVPAQVTVAAWIYKEPDIHAYGGIVSNHGYNGDFTFRSYEGKLSFALWEADGSTRKLVGPTSLNSHQWYHVAAVADGAEIRMYVDGVPYGNPMSYDGTIRATPSRLVSIGWDNYDNSRRWKGRLDDVRIYDRALSAGEIAQLAAQ